MDTHDIITVVRDPRHTLGKQFEFASDGSVLKKTGVAVAVAVATQHHVPDVEALAALLSQVSEDSNAAIINSVFPSIPVDIPFLILSEKKLLEYGIKRFDETVTWPVTLDYSGGEYLALGRFKEHMSPSSWLLLDRDIDKHTPPYYAERNYEEWLADVDKLLPGILGCARLRAHSSSARVSCQGHPVGGGNGHTWVQVKNPEDINRMRSVIQARALDLGMTWCKPRHSRKTGDVVGHGIASIVDWSVFTTGRLVFAGKPEVFDAL